MSSSKKKVQNANLAAKTQIKKKRIRRSIQQIILDKIQKAYKNIAPTEMEQELKKIAEILIQLEEKNKENKKSNKIIKMAKTKSPEEIKQIIEQLQSMVK